MPEWKTTPKPVTVPKGGDRMLIGLASTVLSELPPSVRAASPDVQNHVSAVTKRVLARRGIKPHWQPRVADKVLDWVMEQRK